MIVNSILLVLPDPLTMCRFDPQLDTASSLLAVCRCSAYQLPSIHAQRGNYHHPELRITARLRTPSGNRCEAIPPFRICRL